MPLLPIAGYAATALLAAFSAAGATEATARLQISVAVPRHSTIVESTAPACFPPASTAIADSILETSVVYRVRSTSTTGIELVFEPAAAVESLSVRITGETDVISIPALGGSVTLRGHPLGESTVDVEYRIGLDAGAEADCIAWPVRVEARPL